FMTTIAVNRNGVLGVMWYDRRDSPDNLGWTPRFSVSYDGGDTFVPSVKLATSPFAEQNSKRVELFTSSYGFMNRKAKHAGPIDGALQLARGQFQGGDYARLPTNLDSVLHAL